MTHHVVCHSCAFEQVCDDGEAASGGAHLHRLKTNHDVEFERID